MADYKLDITYEIVTPESAELGDNAESGFEDENMKFDSLSELIDYMLNEGAAEPSNSNYFHANTWYNTVDPIQDRAYFEKGESKFLGFHPKGVTEEEGKIIFDSITQRKNLAPDEDLKFASENQALQYLADLTGQRIKIGTASWLSGKDYFDVAQGLYWFAAEHHGGQNSSLYSIMSAQLKYNPSPSENGPDSGDAQEVYDYLASMEDSEQDDAAEEALEYVQEEYDKSHE